MAIANLTLRFLLELAGAAALAYAAFDLAGDGVVRIVAAVAAAALFIGVWAFVVAPKAANGLSQPQKDVIGTALLLLAAVALWLAGQPGLAIGFAVIILVNAALLFAFGAGARDSFGAAGR